MPIWDDKGATSSGATAIAPHGDKCDGGPRAFKPALALDEASTPPEEIITHIFVHGGLGEIRSGASPKTFGANHAIWYHQSLVCPWL
jgi:hypothetical protein